uniref:Uncharacterized protein n=1 Tax=Arundo donax TaxID=35708 RepID=A0A0A9FE05_ARUDO
MLLRNIMYYQIYVCVSWRRSNAMNNPGYKCSTAEDASIQ